MSILATLASYFLHIDKQLQLRTCTFRLVLTVLCGESTHANFYDTLSRASSISFEQLARIWTELGGSDYQSLCCPVK